MAIQDLGARAATAGGERGELVMEPDVTRPADGLGAGLQYRIQAQLRHIRVRPRAGGRVPSRVGAAAPGGQPAEQLPPRRGTGQRGVPGDPVPAIGWGAAGVDRPGHSHLGEDLHGALAEQVRPGQPRGRRVPLDQDHVNPPLAQQSSRRQTGWPAANDEYLHLLPGGAERRA